MEKSGRLVSMGCVPSLFTSVRLSGKQTDAKHGVPTGRLGFGLTDAQQRIPTRRLWLVAAISAGALDEIHEFMRVAAVAVNDDGAAAAVIAALIVARLCRIQHALTRV